MTEDIEDRADILTQAFKATVLYLTKRFGDDPEKWTWSSIHTLEHGHPLGNVEALRATFNVGPYNLSGSEMVLNNLGFPYTEENLFKSSFGPSTRRIVDFSDLDKSESILPTGQSGVPFSRHYRDQADLYVKGEWRPMYMNKDLIIENSTYLILRAKTK